MKKLKSYVIIWNRERGMRVKMENPQKCFGCGQENKDGLKLSFSYSENKAWTETKLENKFQGFPGIAHGGIVTTLLDEVMANILMKKGLFAVTAKLEVRFKEPVPIEENILLAGEVDEEKSSSRLKYLSAWIEDEKGKVLAQAEGVFVDQTKKIMERKSEEES